MKTTLVTLSLVLAAAASAAASAAVTVQPAPAVTSPAPADAAALRRRSLPLAAMAPGGGSFPIRLTGTEPAQYFDFALRRDEAAAAAVLDLTLTASPSLLPETSQVNVFLNGELQTTVQLKKELLGQRARAEVPLDAKLLKPQNQLMLQFVGHYQPVCENPANEALWLSIAPESRLTLTTERLKVANDLALFPAPFIDAAGTDEGPAVLPLVLPADPSRDVKEAAALFASLAGKLAGWRGIELPVYYNEAPPERHFVAFASQTAAPDFLKARATSNPAVTMADAPLSRTAKMLVISGASDADLIRAVLAIADKNRVLIGETLAASGTHPAKAEPWTASKWLPEGRPVTMKELAQYPGQLTAKAQSQATVSLPLALAPDLWITDKTNLTLDLAYRYTRPVNEADAQLRVTVNGVLADAVNAPANESRAEVKTPLASQTGPLASRASTAPALAAANTLNLTLAYTRHFAEGSLTNCRSASLLPQQLEVEPGSTVTLEGAYHWTVLPNLALFAAGGFPYTRYADLSETVIVAPKGISAGNFSALLTTIARAANATGDAGLNLALTESWKDSQLTGRDILTAGRLPEGELADFNEKAARDLTTHLATDLKAGHPLLQAADAAAPTAVIASFESPFTSGRTVTALLTEGEAGARLLARRLADPSALAELHGTLAVLTPEAAYSFDAAKTYQSGNLPWYRRVWTAVGGHPLWVSLAALLCALIAGTGVYRFMRRQVRGRE